MHFKKELKKSKNEKIIYDLGEDVLSNWLNKDQFKSKFLELSGLELAPGWIDIHTKLTN
tara:strand:- start:319 stop:495 length:177 start_codon:yes stop_codon:yes gene_type:complete